VNCVIPVTYVRLYYFCPAIGTTCIGWRFGW